MTRRSVGLRSERGPILLSLMLATSLVALDSTVIATAVPSVVASLGGFDQFPWLFSIYLLAQAVSVPVYGKLADQFGRKPLMLLGIGLFLAGSVLCGVAWSMPALIVFRALQGLGAGAVQPMSITIAGDIYTVAERAKAQGYLASVWGISAVVGPALGGVFSQWVSWRWIFFINIPLCVLAGWMLSRNFHEQVARRRPRIDYAGAVLLTAGCSLVMVALLEGGLAWPWSSGTSVALIAAAGLMLVGFVLVERRAAEPILPLWVFRRRVLLASGLASLMVGAITLGLSSYLPTFSQISLGVGPIVAGFALAALTVGWPIAGSQAGRFYLRIGFRATAVIGASVAVIGTGALSTLSERSPIELVAVFCFVIGLGMGLVATPTVIAAQSSVGWSQRGVVTGTNLFSRSVGSALGVAAFGAIANATLAGHPQDGPRVALASHHVFLVVAGAAVVMLVAAAFMPGHRAQGAEVIDQPEEAAPPRASASASEQ